MEITTKNKLETQKLAGLLARETLASLKENTARGPVVFSLEGNLGAGKTAFAQGFARALGIREKVASPTFVLLKKYALPKHGRAEHFHLYHLDWYRFEKAAEPAGIGWEDILADARGIVLVEWGDRARKALPSNYIKIEFATTGATKRRIRITSISV